MKCPYCAHNDLRVVETREGDHTTLRRRRACNGCQKRFTTYERIDQPDLVVLKKGGKKQPFDIDKLMKGVLIACSKRPVPLDQVERLVEDIHANLRSRETVEVPAQIIGNLVMQRLKELDPIAYIRFASVYQDFATLAQFHKEVNKLKKEVS